MNGATVLVVDDDPAVREALVQTLELGGFRAIPAASFIEAKDHIAADFAGVVLSDIRMPGKDGFALLEYALKTDPGLPVILLTGEGDVPTAVRGMHQGAYDFLEKPCAPKRLVEVVEKAWQTRSLILENRRLKSALEQAAHERIGFLGVSEAARSVRAAIQRASASRAPVLISGPPGSGRGFVARLLHAARGERSKLVTFDCISPFSASLPDGKAWLLAEPERLDLADQRRLLARLDGAGASAVYATTGPDPESRIERGGLDSELFYALGVARIEVPSLADRPEDVPILFELFLRDEAEAGAPLARDAAEGEGRGLAGYDWSSNLPALRNHAKRVAWGLAPEPGDTSLKAQMERVERGIIQDSLRRTGGHATQAAAMLGLPRKTFYDRLQKLGIRAEDFRES